MSNLVYVDYNTAHEIVNNNRNLYWDGWDIIEWRKDPDACFNKYGMFRNGSWGKARRITVSNDGTWKVSSKYVMGK